MISVEARGRLGNHMFQFAFGLATAARLGTDFAMNDKLLRPAFRLGNWGRPIRRTERSMRYRLAKRRKSLKVVKVDNEQEPDDVVPTLTDHVHYTGFFQSLRYFDDAESAVRAAFEPRPPHVDAFRNRYSELLASPYVCCHVRRTDYERGGFMLPLSYYRECLRLADVTPGTPIVFVGDDLADVEHEFAADSNVRMERNDAIVDLQLLIHAAISVTSNSSFGWWGSWLGTSGRPVFAPKFWLGFKMGTEIPRGVVPPSWEQVPVPVG